MHAALERGRSGRPLRVRAQAAAEQKAAMEVAAKQAQATKALAAKSSSQAYLLALRVDNMS